MKKLFAVIFSLHLMIAPVAMAQEGSAGDQFRANPDAKPAGMDYMHILKSMVLGAVGTSAIQCTQFARLPSIMLFAAGSLAYVATELMAGKDQGNFLKRKAADIEMLQEKMKGVGGAGEVQRATLEAALKDEEEILAIVTKKLKGIKTVSMILKAATALSIVEAIGEKFGLFPPFAGCNPGSMAPIQLTVGKGMAAVYGLTAMKSGGLISGAATFGAAYVVGQGIVGGMISGALNTATTRIAAFAIATALFSTSSGKLSALKSTVEGNIEKLKSVLAEFDKNTIAGVSTINGNATNSTGTNAGAAGGVTSGVGGGAGGRITPSTSSRDFGLYALANVSNDPSKNCFTNSSDGPSYSTDCKNPMKLAYPNIDPSINVPTLRDATNASIDFANGIASGDTAKADAASGSLNSMAGKIDDTQKNLLDQLNAQRKKDNLAAFDLEAEKAKMNGQIDSALSGELKSKGVDVAALSKMNFLGSDKAGEDKDGKLDVNTASSDNTLILPQGSAGVESGAAGGAGISEGLTNAESTVTEGDLSQTPGMENALNQFESNENDISERSEDSIFKQVSNRYQANYSRFFKRKEIPKDP